MKASYGIGTTRVKTGCRPLDLFLFFGGYLATVNQVRDKVGDCSSFGLQQERREESEYETVLNRPRTRSEIKGAPFDRAQTRMTCQSDQIAIVATRARFCGSRHLGTIRGCNEGREGSRRRRDQERGGRSAGRLPRRQCEPMNRPRFLVCIREISGE